MPFSADAVKPDIIYGAVKSTSFGEIDVIYKGIALCSS